MECMTREKLAEVVDFIETIGGSILNQFGEKVRDKELFLDTHFPRTKRELFTAQTVLDNITVIGWQDNTFHVFKSVDLNYGMQANGHVEDNNVLKDIQWLGTGEE